MHMPASRPKAVFLCTKPLQIMVSLCVVQELRSTHDCHLVIAGHFAHAETVASKCSVHLGEFASVQYVDNWADFVLHAIHLRAQLLLIDSDVGVRTAINLLKVRARLPAASVHVYEEGIGTYRTDLYTGPKKWILKTAGIATYFGGSALVDCVWIFNPHLYAARQGSSRKVMTIRQSLPALLTARRSSLELIFGANTLSPAFLALRSRVQRCLVYLSSWTVDFDLLDGLRARCDLLVLKLHPHILESSAAYAKAVLLPGVFLAPTGAPAELVITAAEEVFGSVEVIHHGSSVTQYLFSPGIHFSEAPATPALV